MPSELKTINGKPVLILDLEEPAAIGAYAVAARKTRPQLAADLDDIANSRVGKEEK